MGDSSGEVWGVVGAGALGQTFAAKLRLAGHAVLLHSRPQGVEKLLSAGQIQCRGLVNEAVRVSGQPGSDAVQVTADPQQLMANATGILFTTKAHQLPAAVRDVAGTGDSSSLQWVAGVQNGISKDAVLAAAFGESTVVGMVTVVGAQRSTDQDLEVTALGPTYVGEIPSGLSPRAQAIADVLAGAGLGGVAVDNIRTAQWSKACNAIAMFAISTLTRLPNPVLRSNRLLMSTYIDLVEECAQVAAREGVELGDYPNYPLRTLLGQSHEEGLESLVRPVTPGSRGTYSSMAFDAIHGREMEVDEIYGAMIARADEFRLQIPRLRTVTKLLQGLADHVSETIQ